MNQTDDTQMNKTLDELIREVTTIRTIAEKSSTQQNLEKYRDHLNQLQIQLDKQIKNHTSSHFSYEFYEDSSQCVELITQIRFIRTFRPQLKASGLFNALNQIVATVRQAVFRHEALKDQSEDTLLGSLANLQSLSPEMIRTQIEEATLKVAAAIAEAEKANEVGADLLEKMQNEQLNTNAKTFVSDETMAETMDITRKMFVKNAASIIITDEAATKILELEELL